MKINVSGVTKRVVRPFIDVTTWMGYKQLAEMTRGIFQPAKNLFIPKKEIDSDKESFESALKHYNLSEPDIRQRIRIFTLLSIMWVVISLALIIYGVYLAGMRSWFGFSACLAISLLTLVQSFYYHFWRFQMKQRRLGCTFKEWLNANFTSGGER